MQPRKSVRRKKMKREDLKTKLTAAGVAEDKLSEVVDYIMAANGADINGLKEELSNTNTKHAEELKKFQDESKALKAQVEGYKDYEDLKKFKADTIEKAEMNKKVEFLKAQGCKHPDLVLGKIDFTNAEYDEESKTYKGLDEAVNGLKNTYGDLFEQSGNRVDPIPAKADSPSSDFEKYKAAHPTWKFD